MAATLTTPADSVLLTIVDSVLISPYIDQYGQHYFTVLARCLWTWLVSRPNIRDAVP
jgi:hypothetical protein